MPIRRKNVDLMRPKRSTKRNKLFEYLSSPCVQYLMIFLLWGILLLINQSTEMRFEYFWPGWLFICSTHDSLKYQGLQYTLFFVIIVLTMDLLFFFLFPSSWIYFCGSAYVWIYLLWHTDQGLCFLTLTFCLTFVYFELGFQSRDVKFNHSIYFFRPFAAHSMGYPVVCMGFSIMRYLEVRHRKNKTLNVRRQNCLYFRILRDAVPVSILTDFSNGTCPTYLPDYESDTQNSKSTLIPDGGDCNLSWSIFLFSQLVSSCFSRLGQWCFSYPLPLDHEISNGALVSSHALCSRSNHSGGTGGGENFGASCIASPDTGLVECADNHQLAGACSAGPRPSTNAAVRLRTAATTTSLEAVSSAVGGSSHAAFALATRQPGGGKTVNQTSSSQITAAATLVSTNNSTAVFPRCLKDNPNLRLENAIRRLKSDVQSMRAVESQLRGQLTHLESESQLSRERLTEQRQANEAMLARIGKLNSRSRNERAGLAGLEHSLAEERRLRALVQEQVTALQAQLAPLAVVVSPLSAVGELLPSAEKAVQTSTSTSDTNSSVVPRPVNQPDGESDCCRRRRLLESELRSVCRQQQQQLRSLSTTTTTTDQPAASCDASAWSRGKSAGQTATAVAASSSGSGQRTVEELAVGRHSMSQCQRLVLETCILAASKERARLEYKLKEENWMKQQLFTEFHNSVGETNSLKNTLKQRDSQISELSQKVDQYERCLAFAAAGDRLRPASLVNRSVDCEPGPSKSQMAAGLWTPSPVCCSAAGLSGQLQPGKPGSFAGGRGGSTDVCHPPLSPLSSPPFKFTPNGPTCTVSATGYSAEDLSFLLQQATSAVSICDLPILNSSSASSGAICGTVTTADSDAGYLSSVRLSESCSNGEEPFDELQLSLDSGAGRATGTGDFLTSNARMSDSSPDAVGKGRRALHRQAVTLVNNSPPLDSVGYSTGLGEATVGPGSSSLQTESL